MGLNNIPIGKERNNMKKLLSVLLAAVLALSLVAGAFAESTEIATLNDTDVIVTVNGTAFTWADASVEYDALVEEYGSYYDMTAKDSIDLFRAVAQYNVVVKALAEQQAVALGLAPLTDEEKVAADAEARAEWNEVVESYTTSVSGITADSTDEEKAAAVAEAEAYILENYGYTADSYASAYVDNVVSTRLYDYLTKDIVVTDEDVQADIAAKVEEDKALYEDDLEGYCSAVSNAELMAYYTYMYTGEYSVEYPHYRPAGFRAVKHVLLAVDEEALNAYNELTATFEEQQNPSEETTETTTETTEPAEPVTQEQIDAAALAIIDANAETIAKIQEAYANGEDFDTLIANYSTDSGNTYEVCPYSDSSYVKPFVTAAMSIENIGELSAPTLSQYGIHIVLYVSDVEAGAITMSDSEIETLRSQLLETKKSDAYAAGVDAFKETSVIEYSGLITTIEELDSEEASSDAEVVEVVEEEVAEEEVQAE